MAAATRNSENMEFARNAANSLDYESLLPRTIQAASLSEASRCKGLLDQVVVLVHDFLGERYEHPNQVSLGYFKDQISAVCNVFDKARQNRVLVLKDAGNTFDLDIVVDVANPLARRGITGLSQRRLEYDDESEAELPPPPPQHILNWLQSIDLDVAPVRQVGREEAARSFVTLFVDAFRMLAGSGGGSGTLVQSGQGSQRYRADATLKNWFLECWPLFNYSPKRFGNATTWPVFDTLPVSGDYMFQGLKGTQIKMDPSPHYLGPTRTSTIVKL
jgi:hypothetical protein